jgi:hypothetical protein
MENIGIDSIFISEQVIQTIGDPREFKSMARKMQGKHVVGFRRGWIN